jgi:hypothetical protein
LRIRVRNAKTGLQFKSEKTILLGTGNEHANGETTMDATNAIEIKENKGGWSGQYNPRTSRPFAVFVNGRALRTESGAYRTFATREAAMKAGEESCK